MDIDNNYILLKFENIIKNLKNEETVKDLQYLLKIFSDLHYSSIKWIIK